MLLPRLFVFFLFLLAAAPSSIAAQSSCAQTVATGNRTCSSAAQSTFCSTTLQVVTITYSDGSCTSPSLARMVPVDTCVDGIARTCPASSTRVDVTSLFSSAVQVQSCTASAVRSFALRESTCVSLGSQKYVTLSCANLDDTVDVSTFTTSDCTGDPLHVKAVVSGECNEDTNYRFTCPSSDAHALCPSSILALLVLSLVAAMRS